MSNSCSRCKKGEPKEGFNTCEKCQQYSRLYRLQMKKAPKLKPEDKKNKRRGVSCGRRTCSQCKKWRHLVDFCVAQWKDPTVREEPQYFRNICRTCERINGRVSNAKRNGRDKPYAPLVYKSCLAEERSARRRKSRNEWQRKKLKEDPVWAERYRENQRFYAEQKRRERGAAVRKKVKQSNYKRSTDSDLIEIKPFQQWIESKIEVYGSIESFALAVDANVRSIHRWRSGKEIDKRGKERVIAMIPLHTVDVAITREGNTALWEIYPDLYK